MNTLRTDPWTLVNGLSRDIDRILLGTGRTGATADWSPAVDIREHEDRFEIVADVPGIEPEKLEITLHEGVLSISGERQGGDEATVGRLRTERGRGTFRRQFRLPETIAPDGLTAECRNGVLTIAVPKKAKPAPFRIEVKAD